jgi:hypothetical protein
VQVCAGNKDQQASIKERLGLVLTSAKKRTEKINYAGSKTLPASIKEKETHLPKVP